MIKVPPSLFALLLVVLGYTQERPIKIVEKKIPNRLMLYAVNENEQDLDVKITITGTNIRQSKAKPRFIRVPSTSKVHMKTLILMRGKKPSYTYELEVNDSLSKRALKKPAEKIKIRPDKQIVLYVPKNCMDCDSLIGSLENGKYIYTLHHLAKSPKISEQLTRSMGNGVVLDSLKTPIVNLGGKLYTKIGTYEKLLEELKK